MYDSRSWLIIYFKRNSMYMSVLNSQFIPPHQRDTIFASSEFSIVCTFCRFIKSHLAGSAQESFGISGSVLESL